MPVRASFRFAALACAAGLLAGCGGSSNSGAGSVAPLAAPNAPGGPVTGKIAHVVILIQENRSFDNLFYGFPGADTATAGLRHDGTSVALGPVPLEDGRDIGHFHYSFELAFDGGRMDGFDLEQGYGFVNGAYTVVPQDPDLPYSYVPHAESAPYIQLAQQYTLADRMFESNNGPSYPSHQYLIAGQSDDADEVPTKGPWGCDAPPGTTVAQLLPNGTDSNGVFPCFDYETLGDLLDAAGISWRYYV
ncbi:MAG: alkaline phosphatase family protein, partial [Candidatus Dormibacteria bacterium]